MKKSRLDLLVVERGLFESRQAAQTAIMDGAVIVNGEKVTKPGFNIDNDANVELVPGFFVKKYVSRGGLKLEKALETFAIDVNERVCLDIGASTGGFTDCLLKRGASRVYAIDVGYGQLDWSIRNDPRVVVLERVNARYLEPAQLYLDDMPWANLLVSDVSFISLAKIIPSVVKLLVPNQSELVCLVKPQFEVGRRFVEKGGVVRSPDAHVSAIQSVITSAGENGLNLRALTFSPITGPAGNIEYLVQFANAGETAAIDCDAVVKDAFSTLSK